MEKKKLPTQLDKNGNPVRRPAAPGGKPAAKKRTPPKAAAPGKRPRPAKPGKPAPAPEPEYPMDWIFLHPADYTVRQLKELFDPIPGLDIEIWPGLGVLEITFPSKAFVDFELTTELPEEPALTAFLAAHPYQTAYYVSVEPACHQAELNFLRDTAQKSGGLLVADNDELSPQFGA